MRFGNTTIFLTAALVGCLAMLAWAGTCNSTCALTLTGTTGGGSTYTTKAQGGFATTSIATGGCPTGTVQEKGIAIDVRTDTYTANTDDNPPVACNKQWTVNYTVQMEDYASATSGPCTLNGVPYDRGEGFGSAWAGDDANNIVGPPPAHVVAPGPNGSGQILNPLIPFTTPPLTVCAHTTQFSLACNAMTGIQSTTCQVQGQGTGYGHARYVFSGVVKHEVINNC